MNDKSVVLRNVSDAKEGSRHLAASVTAAGDLVIEGQDLGDGVERALGVREYEWVWTIRAPHVAAFLRAMGTTGDVLPAMSERFGGERAGEIKSFLESRGVPHETWSRLGD